MSDAIVNGVRLHYRVDGPEAAPVVALVNSLGTDLTMWEPQIAALTPRYRVLRHDTRGHGESEAPSGPEGVEIPAANTLGIPRGLTDQPTSVISH